MIVDCAQWTDDCMKGQRPLIVGSGPVGLVLALFLSQRGIPVVVVEGGGPSSQPYDALDLEVECTASTLEGATIGRSRQIGGGLNLWGGQLASLAKNEVLSQGTPGSLCWPVPLDEITSRFAVVAELLGQPSMSLPLEPTMIETELGPLRERSLDIVATAWLKRPKLSARFWKELEASRLVTLVSGAFVDRITHGPQPGSITGVSALRRDKSRISFEASCVVLACGAIETSRLLLQPALSSDAQPWHSLAWLGRGFNEHLDATTAVIRPIDKRRLLDVFDPVVVKGTKYTFKLCAETGDQRTIRLSSVAMLTMPGNVRNSIAELYMLSRGVAPRQLAGNACDIGAAAFASAREVLPLALRYLRCKRIGTVIRGDGSLRVSVEQPIRRSSRITLSPMKRDSRGIAAARIHWQKGAEEGRAFVETTRRVKGWAEANGVAHVVIDPALLEDPTGFAERADDGLHHAGGARMAKRPEEGVVDPNLKVFGVEGLYCCGSSVFPRSGLANPTMTAMALAVRLGEHLMSIGRVS